MQEDPFATQTPLALRVVIAVVIGSAGLVFGTFGARSLELPWTLALPAGGVCLLIFALLAWSFPAAFFKNRS